MTEVETQAEREGEAGRMEKLAQWFDSRLGLSHQFLRPVPEYAINPFYWLGALAVVAFVIQGVTGVMMMLYYVPTTAQAYSSTQFIFQSVAYGSFLETVHLYTAYAMILLAFMHLMRGYFVSVHKKPRELMWVVGMLMGLVTLGFGFTGYLLPWTVVSKSATDVGVGMIDALPQPISSFISFLIIGGGGAGAELLRFYDLHVVVLPAVLLVLLVVKMYLLESHGVSEPVTASPTQEGKRRLIPIFPDVSFYLLELAALFGSLMLFVAAAFPLTLAPQYTPQLASQFTAQPEWYFLWIYQLLKISAFEEAGLPVAISVVSVIIALIFLLPFIDRGKTRMIGQRPKYTTLGAIFAAEVIVLAYWGMVTPGRVIPNWQAALVLGGTAVAVALISLVLHRLIFRRLVTSSADARKALAAPSVRWASAWTAGSFAFLMALGALSIGWLVNSVSQALLGGSAEVLATLVLSAAGLAVTLLGTLYLLYRLDLGTGMIKRRIKAF
jgi:quinol-cytochrome oxidoreductase complex cytochrome b subunit